MAATGIFKDVNHIRNPVLIALHHENASPWLAGPSGFCPAPSASLAAHLFPSLPLLQRHSPHWFHAHPTLSPSRNVVREIPLSSKLFSLSSSQHHLHSLPGPLCLGRMSPLSYFHPHQTVNSVGASTTGLLSHCCPSRPGRMPDSTLVIVGRDCPLFTQVCSPSHSNRIQAAHCQVPN